MRPSPRRNNAVCIAMLPLVAAAAPTTAAATDGSFEGHFSVGLREVKVSGDDTKYRQHVNLEDGPRLFAVGVSLEPGSAHAAAPDRLTLDASGIGGDPYQTLRLEARKYGGYRFTYDHQRSDYFYEDLLTRPEDASVEGSTGGDFHHFDFERERDRVKLDVDIGDRAGLTMGFDRYEKNGDGTTTLDIEREEFELDKPIDETMQRYDLGFHYSWDRVELTINEQWQDYENASSAFLPGASPGSEPGAPAELDFFILDQPYQYDARDHAIGLRLRPGDRWDVELNARLGDLDLDMDARERSQGRDFLGNPFDRDVGGNGAVDRDTEFFQVTTAYSVTDRARITAAASHNKLNQDGELSFGADDGSSEWEIETTGFDAGVELAITPSLAAGAGWSHQKRDSRYRQTLEDFQKTDDVETDRNGYYAHVHYRPMAGLTLTASVEDNSIDDPFTVASATDTLRYRLRARYRHASGVSISATHSQTKHENDNSGWQSNTRQTDVRLTHATDRLTVSLGVAMVDLERDIDQLVTGGSRQDLFAISYSADASFWDAAASWRLTDSVNLAASFRSYDNDGSFEVDRDDARASIEVALPASYALQLSYRNVDFQEDELEFFDADIWELALRYRW